MTKSHIGRVRELYKIILRLHRVLPDDLKILGDNYAREEFKRHKNCKPQEAQIFLNEWREYVVSMSRQASPAGAQRRPAEVSAKPVKSVPGYVAVSSPGHNLGGSGVAGADIQESPGESCRYCKQSVERHTAGAVVDGLITKAGGRSQHFGNNIDGGQLNKFNADQLLLLYDLLMTARGEKPLGEQDYEPTDTVYNKTSGDAKNEILKIDEETFESILGKISGFNTNTTKMEWIKLFDLSEIKNDEVRDAVNSLIHSQLKTALDNLYSAETELEQARKFAGEGVTRSIRDDEYDVLTTAKINAVEHLHETVLKLAMIVKIKTEEDGAALQFAYEMLNNRREDKEKCNNPDNS